MTHQAGVRTVVMGGRPEEGPMQAVGGTRGAFPYSGDDIDDAIDFAESTADANQNLNATLPELIEGYRDSGVFEIFTGVNLRDQVRKNDTVPLQFKYLAADCRLYYTLANVYNMTRLWEDVADAMWTDSNLCVAGSVGYAETGNSTTPKQPPAPPRLTLNSTNPDTFTPAANMSATLGGGFQDLARRPGGVGGKVQTCPTGRCQQGQCRPVPLTCPNGKSVKPNLCQDACVGPNPVCGTGTECDFSSRVESKRTTIGGKVQYKGFCKPLIADASYGC